MKNRAVVLIAVVCALLVSSLALAAPDQYPGDSSIYGTPATLQPNVLIIIDDSGSMNDTIPGTPYNPAIVYPVTNNCGSGSACLSNAVYTVSRGTYTLLNSNVTAITTSCRGANPQQLLETTGQYYGRSLASGGTACGRSGNGTYVTGNYVNYLYSPQGPSTKMNIAKSVVQGLVTSTSGVKFGLMTFRYDAFGNGQGGTFLSVNVPGGGAIPYVTTIKDMDAIFTGTMTNRDAFVGAVNGLSPLYNTPLGETLFEAGRYFAGGAPAFGASIGVGSGGTYTSPVESSCQKNYVVFVTDGMSNADDSSPLTSICTNGDCDGDGVEPGNLNHSLDDVAKYLNLSTNNIVTYTIGFGNIGADPAAVDLLTRAADNNHGKGQYYTAGSQTGLSAAFTQIMGRIFSVNSSYVAPVVPVSPENRTYGGSRVYMGFFRPVGGTYWEGNLKKYAIDGNNNLLDANGNYATWVDLDGNGVDDLTGATLPAGAINGTFKASAQSFWGTAPDGGNVNEGGAGQLLQQRTTPARSIYTVVSNAIVPFDGTNVTPAMLGYTTAADATNLINFIYGHDAYDENLNGNTTENRAWVLGDVLHSRPLIVNYSSYDPTVSGAEGNCSTNQSLIFVGGNDGMLHAFKDCDGSEAWAFVPPDMLGNLQYITGASHTYFVDSSPSVYIYDQNGNGTIEPAQGDKVILLFGERRGGGTAAAPTQGAYYALDVTNPASPSLLWSVSSSSPVTGTPPTPVFGDLAESWSEPKVVRMGIGGQNHIVAIFGAGYDNPNEDGRYGATQGFSGTTPVSLAENGNGAATSTTGATGPSSPRGRGVYVVDLATLNSSGVPSFTTSGQLIKELTSAGMTFSFPGEVAAIDTTNTGYASMLYAADTGGNIWRFNVASSDPTNWTSTKIFSSNPGSGGAGDTGRKIFYKPSVVRESGYTMLFFGTGDREHPLNTSVVDRIYALKDRGQSFAVTESNMYDATADDLQNINTTSTQVSNILSTLNSSTNYGWYIQLNQNTGEKVLAVPTVFNKVANFTTYAPNTAGNTDPCQPGNLGTARIYSLNYLTGEAVLDYSTANDTSVNMSLSNTNTRGIVNAGAAGGTSSNGSATVYVGRDDRSKTIGTGIPSGMVIIINPGGQIGALTGVGGAIAGSNPLQGGSIVPLYWRQK